MKFLLAVFIGLFSVNVFAAKVGESFGKGVFLFEEKVEIYANLWSGIAINDRVEAGQAEVLIRAEGKTADFYGILSINCENTESFWISAVNFGETVDASEVVPKNVVTNASFWFCNN